MTRLAVTDFRPLETEVEAIARLRLHLLLLDVCGHGNTRGAFEFRQLAASIRWLAASVELDLQEPPCAAPLS